VAREVSEISDFWRGRRVFVTGHTGFKGSWLALWLLRRGARVTGYALEAPTRPSLFDAANLDADMHNVLGDVRDPAAVRRAMAEARPDVVLHLAAQSLVRAAYADPIGTYATNVMGTVHVLDAVRHVESVRTVLNVTSDKCYENREWPWPYRENDPMGGHDPYSNSKGCSELVSASYRHAFFEADAGARRVASASARAGNVIGGGDWASDRLVPDLMRGFAGGVPVCIRRPGAVRPWQHVLEPLSGYLRLVERLFGDGEDFHGGWNFGPRLEDTQPVSAVADRLAAEWGSDARWIRDESPHPHEANLLSLDWSKARSRLRWTPTWTLDEALRRTAAWYRSYYDGGAGRVRDACERDIAAFERATAELSLAPPVAHSVTSSHV
jgi:CDP-glucose 4,6-dehydratase